MDLSQLHVFLTVAKEQSFSRAAHKLYRTQPAVSIVIKKLEDSVGQPLLMRGARQVKLTDAYLYELPTMVSVLQVLSIQRPDRNAFTESNMEFKIEGDDLEFTHLDLNGGVISLKGKGRLTGRRDLDLKFYTQIGRGELQIFRPLVGDVNRQFMLIEVTGPLEHPISRKTAFPKLNENLQKIFPELASDDRNMSAPVPRSIFSAPREAMERMIPKRK